MNFKEQCLKCDAQLQEIIIPVTKCCDDKVESDITSIGNIPFYEQNEKVDFDKQLLVSCESETRINDFKRETLQVTVSNSNLCSSNLHFRYLTLTH